MKQILLVTILIFSAYCQVAPIWSQSSRVETRTVELISNHLSVSQTFYWNSTYLKSFTDAPWVGLSIVNLRTSTNAGSIGLMSNISNLYPNTKFQHRINITSPTQVWFLQVRYIAYDGNFNQLSDIGVTYKRYTDTATAASGDRLSTISANPGTYRTESKSTGLTVDTTHTNIVAIFTTGFIGTINSSYFQGNVTDDVQAGGQVNVKFTVHPDTVIKQIAVYVIKADQTNLLSRCWTFVETAITKALYGVQFTFFTYKQVNYQANYMKGLRSFSIRNNFEYNFTAYGLNFTTFNQSYYNDMSHFNIWIRYCPNPYIYFNKVDYLCYILCPAGTYLISADQLCVACDYTCATCSTGTTCDNCAVNRVKNATGNCVCIDYYYEYNSVCLPCHYSCQQCVFPAQYVNCIKCDSSMHRTPPTPTNSTCYCDTANGWTDDGVALCSSKCGDGIINNQQCDDNNLYNDDGCSSTCQFQTYFTCINTSPPSQCYYVGNITVEVVRIQKNPTSNIAAFFVKVTPFVALMKNIKLQNIVTNITGATEVKVSLVGELLVYNVTYASDLEDLTLTIGLKPSATGTFSLFYPVNTTFKAKADNGLILKAYLTAQYTQSTTIGEVAFILGLMFFCFSVLFCYGDWKELGLQMFFALQLCFMSFVVQPNLNPYSTKTCLINPVMGWNNITGQVLPPYHTYGPVLQQMGYSVGFIYNFNIMVIFPGLTLILYFVYRIVLYVHVKKIRQGDTDTPFEQTLQGKFFNHFRFDLFVYWMLINMQQILMGTLIQIQYIDNGGIFVYIALLLIGIIVCIIGLFIRQQSLQAYRKILFHKSYGNRTFLMVLVSTLLIDLILVLSVLVKRQIFFTAFVPPIIVVIYLIIRRPFKLLGNNIRLIIIQCCVLTVFALQVVAMYLPFEIHMDDVIGIIVCMAIIVFVTLILWIYDIVLKILKLTNKKYEEQSQKQSTQKQQQSINQKVRQAGYALVHGQTGSKLPSNYQMSRFNNEPRNSNFKPQLQRSKQPRSPSKTNLRQLNEEKAKDDKRLRSINNMDEAQVSPSNNPQNQSTIIKQKNPRKKSDISSLPAREDTIQRLSPSTRRRVNPYQQILDETQHKIV